MRRASRRRPAARATFFVTLLVSHTLYVSAQAAGLSGADTPPPLADCATSWQNFCGDADKRPSSLLAVVSRCGDLTQNQAPLRLLCSNTWAAVSTPGGGGVARDARSSASAELGDQLLQYLGALAIVDTGQPSHVAWQSTDVVQGSSGWTAWPGTAVARADLAQELPSTLLLQDAKLQWSDVLPAVRDLVAWYGGRLQALPYAVEVPLVLYQRGALVSAGAGPASTWQELVDLLQRLQQQQQQGQALESSAGVQSDSGDIQQPVAGFCNALPPGCGRDADLLVSIWGSAALPALPAPASRRDLEVLLDGQLLSSEAREGLGQALRLYRDLMVLAPRGAGHAPCQRPRLKVALEQCAVVVGAGSTIKAALWRLSHEQQQRRRRRGERRRATAVAALGHPNPRGLAETVEQGVALTAPLPGSSIAAPGTCSSSEPGGGACSLGDVQRAVYLGRDVQSFQINRMAEPEVQYITWQAAAVALGPASSWPAVLSPTEGGATVLRESQLADVDRWASYGYDAHDIAAYLAALRESLVGPLTFTAPRLPEPLGTKVLDIIISAANAAMFDTNVDVDVIAKVAILNLTTLYSANRASLLYYLAKHLGLKLDTATAPEPSSGGGGLARPAMAGVIVSCVVGGAAFVTLVVVLVWARRTSSVGARRTRITLLDRTSAAPGFGPDTTLMLTDVQDSTRLWESLPAAVMDSALSLHNDAFRQLLPRFRGYECHTEGDSFVLAFHTAVEAAAFALEVQLVLLQLNWPQELLDHDLCSLVRQAAPASDSNEGVAPGGGVQFGASNDGTGTANNASIGGLDDGLMLSCSGATAMLPTRLPTDYGDIAAMGSSLSMIEPWGLQAVDEEQAAILNSEERLIKSLYQSGSKRPVGRSRTFSTLQSHRQQERNTWAAGLRRPVRPSDPPLGPEDSWVGHRSLSESRAELEGGQALGPNPDFAIDSTIDGEDRDSVQLRLRLLRHRQRQRSSPSDPWRLRMDLGREQEHARAAATAGGPLRIGQQSAKSLQLPPWFSSEVTRPTMGPGGSIGTAPGPGWAAGAALGDMTPMSGTYVEADEEASLRLPLATAMPSYSHPSPVARAPSQDLGSRQLWRRSTEVSGNSNPLNSKSLCLMRSRTSNRSSAGTTPPFTGLLATLRVSGDGDGGGGASGPGGTLGVIGGVDFLLRAALASSARRHRRSGDGDGMAAGVADGSRDSLGGAEAPLIVVGDASERRRRRRQHRSSIARASVDYDFDLASSDDSMGRDGGGNDRTSQQLAAPDSARLQACRDPPATSWLATASLPPDDTAAAAATTRTAAMPLAPFHWNSLPEGEEEEAEEEEEEEEEEQEPGPRGHGHPDVSGDSILLQGLVQMLPTSPTAEVAPDLPDPLAPFGGVAALDLPVRGSTEAPWRELELLPAATAHTRMLDPEQQQPQPRQQPRASQFHERTVTTATGDMTDHVTSTTSSVGVVTACSLVLGGTWDTAEVLAATLPPTSCQSPPQQQQLQSQHQHATALTQSICGESLSTGGNAGSVTSNMIEVSASGFSVTTAFTSASAPAPAAGPPPLEMPFNDILSGAYDLLSRSRGSDIGSGPSTTEIAQWLACFPSGAQAPGVQQQPRVMNTNAAQRRVTMPSELRGAAAADVGRSAVSDSLSTDTAVGGDVTFPSVATSGSAGGIGSHAAPGRGHASGTVRRTFSELYFSTQPGSPPAPSGLAVASPVFRSMRRGVSRSASVGNFGAGDEAAGGRIGAPAAAASSLAGPSGGSGNSRGGSQLLINTLARRQRITAEYVQSPLSRQGTLVGGEGAPGRNSEAAVRPSGSVTATGFAASGRMGSRRAVEALGAASVHHHHLHQQQQQLPLPQGDSSSAPWRSLEVVVPPPPSYEQWSHATSAETVAVARSGAATPPSTAVTSPGSVRVQVLQATVDPHASFKRARRQDSNTHSDPGGVAEEPLQLPLPIVLPQIRPREPRPLSSTSIHRSSLPLADFDSPSPPVATRALASLSSRAAGYASAGPLQTTSVADMTPRRRPPMRSVTPPPRMPHHSHSTFLRGPWGTTSGYGSAVLVKNSSSAAGAPLQPPHESARMWGGLEALMEAYTQARGPVGRVQHVGRVRGSVSLSSNSTAQGGDSIAGATGALYDSRILPDGRSSDSRGAVLLSYSGALHGMLEVGHGSNGNAPQRDSSALALMSSRDGGERGRDSNTSRLMNALGTALRSKRISRGGASWGTFNAAGDSGNVGQSKRLSAFSGRESASTARGDGVASGGSGSPSTFMEAMLQLATGTASHQHSPAVASAILAAGGGSGTGLRRSVSPLLLFGGGGSNGGRSQHLLQRLAGLGSRESDHSGAVQTSGGPGSQSGAQPPAGVAAAGGSVHGGIGNATTSYSPMRHPLTNAASSFGAVGSKVLSGNGSIWGPGGPSNGGVSTDGPMALGNTVYGTSSSWAHVSQPLATRFPSYLYPLAAVESYGSGHDSDPAPAAECRPAPAVPARLRPTSSQGATNSFGGGGGGLFRQASGNVSGAAWREPRASRMSAPGTWNHVDGTTPNEVRGSGSAGGGSGNGVSGSGSAIGGVATIAGGGHGHGHGQGISGSWALSIRPVSPRPTGRSSHDIRRAPTAPLLVTSQLSAPLGGGAVLTSERPGGGGGGGSSLHFHALSLPLRTAAQLEGTSEPNEPVSRSILRTLDYEPLPQACSSEQSYASLAVGTVGASQETSLQGAPLPASNRGGPNAVLSKPAPAASETVGFRVPVALHNTGGSSLDPERSRLSFLQQPWQGRGRQSAAKVVLIRAERRSAERAGDDWSGSMFNKSEKHAVGRDGAMGGEGLVGRAVRLSLLALRNIGASSQVAAITRPTSAQAEAAAAVLTHGLVSANESASGTGGPISSALESIEEAPSWGLAAQLISYGVRQTEDSDASALAGGGAAAAAAAALNHSMHGVSQRTSRGERHSGAAMVVPSRMSSHRGRSSAGGNQHEVGDVAMTAIPQETQSPSSTQPVSRRSFKEPSDDNHEIDCPHPVSTAPVGTNMAAGAAVSGSSLRTSRAALTLNAVMEASGSAGGGGGGGGGSRNPGGGRSTKCRPVSRNPTPERLMAGLVRRLDSIVSHGVGGALDMPQWDAAARDGLKSRQASGAASLVNRLGGGVVQRIAPVGKKAAGPPGVPLDSICFRGFRVRCGMHSGLEEGRDVYWTKVCGRRAYSGPSMALAKTVSDLIPGGMVVLTAATFARLQPWPNSEGLPGAIVWARGRFRVSVGEATSNMAPLTEVDLYQLLCPPLLARQPHLERRPWRGAEQVLPGVLNAPLGRLALVMVQVVGVQVLSAWDTEVTRTSLQVFGSVAGEMLPAWGGFPATLDVEGGTLLAAFREPALALGFMHALIDVLRDAEWPAELLEHELGEALAMPLGPSGSIIGFSSGLDGQTLPLPVGSMSLLGSQPGMEGGNLFRGLRLRCVADVASVRVDLGCATAAALYEARDPKAFKALRRMLARSHMGEVLCSGLLVAEVLSGPPTALAALHDLLAFAPLPMTSTNAAAPPPPPSVLPSPLLGQHHHLPPSLLPSPSPPTPGGAYHGHGGTTPVGRQPGGTSNGMLLGGGVVPVSARLTGKEASRTTVYQCTRRRPVRRSGMGQAGFALVGSVGGVYGNAAAGMYRGSLLGVGPSSLTSVGGQSAVGGAGGS